MQDQRTLNWNQFLHARITINSLGFFFSNVSVLIAVIKLRKVILLSGVYSILFCSLRPIKSPQITRKIRSKLLITNRLDDYIFRSLFTLLKTEIFHSSYYVNDRNHAGLSQKMIDGCGEKTDLDVEQLRFLFSGEITRFMLIDFFLFPRKSLKRANDLNLRSDYFSVSWELILLNFFLFSSWFVLDPPLSSLMR